MDVKGEIVLTDRKHLMVQAVECVEEFDEKRFCCAPIWEIWRLPAVICR